MTTGTYPTIDTRLWKKPHPDRNHDWEAWFRDDPEFGLASGPTECQAIENLKVMWNEKNCYGCATQRQTCEHDK